MGIPWLTMNIFSESDTHMQNASQTLVNAGRKASATGGRTSICRESLFAILTQPRLHLLPVINMFVAASPPLHLVHYFEIWPQDLPTYYFFPSAHHVVTIKDGNLFVDPGNSGRGPSFFT